MQHGRNLHCLVLVAVLAGTTVASPALAEASTPPAADTAPLTDPARPICRIARDGFEVQYFTEKPCASRVQIRQSDEPYAARAMRGEKTDPWNGPQVRIVDGSPGDLSLHRVSITGLEPGKRYYYRVFDPGIEPTSQESQFGAAQPWRREFAVSTLAPAGHKAIVRYPVKVLLMPNVVNLQSAVKDPAAPPPKPEQVTAEQLQQIRDEINLASRFFFVNSGMRLWVDFQVVIDPRWQRWGPEPADIDGFYKGWPVCRSYAGEDYHSPGGGRSTIVDMSTPERENDTALIESEPFYGQVEIAFPRKWDAGKKQWTYYTSGGGTLGVDGIPNGLPARSQFFGGYDTAWLTTHEVHHQLESLGAFSLSDREDERIVFNHWAPRSLTRGPDAASGPAGSKGMHPWSTSDRHGEHYDGMAFWDRTLTDAQWLRMYFAQTVTVVDADDDGFPDEDARLPLDEKRFGSSSKSPTSDGHMNDLAKAMLSTWAPAPLQARFQKPLQTFARPNPTAADSDGDGWLDTVDPDPLVPHEPFIYPLTATLDGDDAEWTGIPAAGRFSASGIEVEFRQAHDDKAYYGLFRARGDWGLIRLVIDPEGRGVYTTDAVQTVRVLNGTPIAVDSKDRFFPRAPGLKSATKRRDDGWTIVEFSLPNAGGGAGGEAGDRGLMYWRGAGREVGTYVEVTAPDGRCWSVHEPYHLFYARMLERPGKAPMPASPPAELQPSDPTVIAIFPGDDRLKTRGRGWKPDGKILRHTGPGEDAVYIDGLNATEFDLWARIECKSDAILGAFTPGQSMGAINDYVAFIGGYDNTKSRLRLFGSEAGDTAVVATPGEHTMQLSRKGGVLWCLWDGRVVLWAADPRPSVAVDRLAVLGGYDGQQALHEVRYRIHAAASAEPPTPTPTPTPTKP